MFYTKISYDEKVQRYDRYSLMAISISILSKYILKCHASNLQGFIIIIIQLKRLAVVHD